MESNINLLISDFERHYCTSFIYTSKVKYGITFKSSKITTNKSRLEDLTAKIAKGEYKTVHVGFDFDIDHVNQMQILLDKIMAEYYELYGYSGIQEKFYAVAQRLRGATDITTEAVADKLLDGLWNKLMGSDKTPKKQTKKEKKEAEEKAFILNRNLALMKKYNSGNV